ncbi:MAG: hypothetical protein MJK04_09785, partial [Psychrosphaera sp.]|nr:hypothetical protein [Psychrosphaera sp.]
MSVLRKRDELFRNNMMRETERMAIQPRDRLLALFDVMGNWFHEETFSGCMFINASAEFSDLKDPCHVLCAEHKKLICDYIEQLAKLAGAQDPLELAKQLNLLSEGAIVNAHVEGDLAAGQRA